MNITQFQAKLREITREADKFKTRVQVRDVLTKSLEQLIRQNLIEDFAVIVGSTHIDVAVQLNQTYGFYFFPVKLTKVLSDIEFVVPTNRP